MEVNQSLYRKRRRANLIGLSLSLFAMALGLAYHNRTRYRFRFDLTPQLVGLEGKRVEVEMQGGERRRFWVSRSTGWCPIHLEVHSTRSHGGVGVWGAPFKHVRVVRER